MAFKVFADANLLLDFTLQRQGFQDAKSIIQSAIDGNIQLCTTPAVLHVTAYFTGQHYSGPQTRQIILTLLNDVLIIDCDQATALIAANSNIDDLEDALQYYTSLRHGVDYFISADKKLKKQAAGYGRLPNGELLENDFIIKVYIRFKDKEELKGIEIVSVEEEYKSAKTNFIIANVKFRSLFALKGNKESNVFVCAVP